MKHFLSQQPTHTTGASCGNAALLPAQRQNGSHWLGQLFFDMPRSDGSVFDLDLPGILQQHWRA
jgi:hypothetical protein